MIAKEMSTNQHITDFHSFLSQVDNSYHERIAKIDLFDTNKTKNWNAGQKKKFAAVFYHLRGYFIEFMWYLANFAEDERIKKIVIDNITEELGMGTKFSHEALYERFAKACGVDIHEEILSKTHYLPFAKEFNHTHIRWLKEHDPLSRFAAFAAYERLDNIDYRNLFDFVRTLDLPSKAHAFFRVHVFVEHFESTFDLLMEIWRECPEKVINAFQFIYSHQYNMWQNLSDAIFKDVKIASPVAP
ncbi:Pyrroloquinoline quinone (Coenzyme PQQ) biosynthesis protein C [Legionella londiniensis]|uniref:Pyrroloquinoline quinone (Coenzyme PQQ) biosynthesis protein C n=2 Tax=Legionella londiniensis TaxID=45068 RepID=A0A0W0VNK5_9GAMM|nr:hypothetical protein Llon_0911 [Legionella londiniensis]STX93417.1 Pyrroloquinoline quinone (Coenzyme PQQ) biosynthesis protein C [Legionella londiniensis]